MIQVGSVLTCLVKDLREHQEVTDPETLSDEILSQSCAGPRTYTEKQLARRFRLEGPRVPRIEETALPEAAAHYLTTQQLRQTVDSAQLTKLQAAILGLVVDGWRLRDISREFGMPYPELFRQYQLMCKRIEKEGSKYDGLYEVYYREVKRYIYRKPRSGGYGS